MPERQESLQAILCVCREIAAHTESPPRLECGCLEDKSLCRLFMWWNTHTLQWCRTAYEMTMHTCTEACAHTSAHTHTQIHFIWYICENILCLRTCHSHNRISGTLEVGTVSYSKQHQKNKNKTEQQQKMNNKKQNNVCLVHIWSKVKNTFICIYLYSGFMDHKQFTNCLEMAVSFFSYLGMYCQCVTPLRNWSTNFQLVVCFRQISIHGVWFCGIQKSCSGQGGLENVTKTRAGWSQAGTEDFSERNIVSGILQFLWIRPVLLQVSMFLSFFLLLCILNAVFQLCGTPSPHLPIPEK